MEPVGRILPSIFKREVQRRNPPLVEILAPLWPRVAGKAMAARCRPVAFEAGTLTLATDCANWGAQLRLMAEEIRAKINSFLGASVVQKLCIRSVPRLEPLASSQPAGLASPCGEWPPDAARDPGSPLARTLARSFAQGVARRQKKKHQWR